MQSSAREALSNITKEKAASNAAERAQLSFNAVACGKAATN
jgi:hypothetical protein